jgi:ADP-ribose diphosphatase
MITKNPYEQTGRTGSFGDWDAPPTFGQIEMADAIVTAWRAGLRFLLLVRRRDGRGLAVPGGRIESGEQAFYGAFRELEEETGLDLLHYPFLRRVQSATTLPQRYVPDPRATNDAWAVTTPILVHLGEVDALPEVKGTDDAAEALWVAAPEYSWLEAEAARLGTAVFPAHQEMLREGL